MVTVSESQTFAITPDAGYDEYPDEGIYNIHTRYVKDVMVDGESVGAVTSYTFENVTDDHSIDAIFGETVSRIEIVCDRTFGNYDFGSLAENPVIGLYPYEDGYTPSVTIDGTTVPVETEGDYYWVRIDTTADHTIRITFNPSLSQYTLTTTVQGSGSITKNPHSYFYNSGTIVSLTAVPDSGHRFDHWEGNAAGTQANTAVTVTDEMSVSAVFVPKDEPGIYVRPAGLEIYEDSEDRSRAFYAQNVASTEAADDKGKGLVIPHTVVKYWRTHKPRLSYSRADLTKSEDWSVNDSPVKNQGSCGSCWAFAAAALIENLGNKDDLAEQVLVSCISESNGCSGGWYGYALDHIHNKGLPPEDCYPYIAQNGNCGTQCSSPSFVVKVEEHDTYGRWGVPDQDTVSNLKYLLQTGPVLVSMRVPTDGTFNKYQDGIYDYDGGAVPENRGHAVLAVGYDDDGQYFKVKNSWGPWWGEGGYFRIAYNDVTDHVQFGGYACTASGAYTAEEGDEDTLAFTIENTGVAALSVLLSCDKTWLTYAPQTTFFVYPGEQEEVSVSVSDWSKVAKPEETATISVSSNDPDNPLVIVTVRAVPKTETTGHGVVSGQVITNVAGHPVNVAGATVTIQGRSAVSDAAGKYTIVNVPDGTHEVRFESDHLGSVTKSVTVIQGQISIMPAVSLSCPSQSVVINMQDTNGDNKIGLEEAIRALQIAAGIIE